MKVSDYKLLILVVIVLFLLVLLNQPYTFW